MMMCLSDGIMEDATADFSPAHSFPFLGSVAINMHYRQ